MKNCRDARLGCVRSVPCRVPCGRGLGGLSRRCRAQLASWERGWLLGRLGGSGSPKLLQQSADSKDVSLSRGRTLDRGSSGCVCVCRGWAWGREPPGSGSLYQGPGQGAVIRKEPNPGAISSEMPQKAEPQAAQSGKAVTWDGRPQPPAGSESWGCRPRAGVRGAWGSEDQVDAHVSLDRPSGDP